ncbi:MAG TPA: hypothetical protein VGR90_02370 [Acidimicrobiales bacterium]|nr:hypothetical protein [Acidimicrobiales bacterium]
MHEVAPTYAYLLGLHNRHTGCVVVGSYSNQWPCLFPQHGAGPKHLRPIELADWQVELTVRLHPDRLVRGLIHSDGWRGINRVTGANGHGYDYTRYQFSNRSADIRRIFTDACDALGVQWRKSNAWTVSVSRRPDVANLDRMVGPKR